MSENPPSAELTLTKIDVARRQLGTAIELWFADGDPVSIHVLASAAYEIIHFVSNKNGRRQDLLFDNIIIKDEHRREWAIMLKTPANFFKHANKDHDKLISYNPLYCEVFIMFSIFGLDSVNIERNDVESTFMMWLHFTKPHLLSEKGRKIFIEGIPLEHRSLLRGLSKKDFFEHFMEARRLARRKGMLA